MSDLGIVMPLYYQKEEHIRSAISTILNQSHTNFILFIVIDGALDLLPLVHEIIDGDKRVKIISYKENQGVAYALNKGFEALYQIPSIKYMTWVSNDNIYYPFFLQTLYEGIVKTTSDIGIVYTSYNSIFENGTSADSPQFLESYLRKWMNTIENMFQGCIIGPSFIYKVEYCKRIGPYRFTLIQDYDYFLRMMDYCKIKFIPIETMAYRLNSPFSLSTSISTKPEYHRICWNEVHLAHYETRQRRGIKPELTIVYFLYEATEEILNRYGKLIDQYWTNYKLLLVNCSPKNNIKQINAKYFDMRVSYIDGVNSSPINELNKAKVNLDTPYFMICDGSLLFSEPTMLKPLISTLNENPNYSFVHYNNIDKIVSSTDKNPLLKPYVIYRSEVIKKEQS
ncbi:glycosyltransferase [Bacillus sp. J37]|uniref:glycosyltransferase family 2 protein n=1 Tax=Bacillus sp. J37 TaxID=935837 RepID=UPI0004B4B268|nr:glycosyltransferase [Bacillus sp. J37]